MSSLASWLAFFGGGGTVTGLVAAARYLSDERVRHRAEKKAAAQAPLEAKSYELRIAERAGRIAETAGEIQHQTMEDLRRAYAELAERFAKDRKESEERFEKYRAEAEKQREKDMNEADRLRENDRILLASARDEIRRLTEKVQDQDATITQLRFELERRGAGA